MDEILQSGTRSQRKVLLWENADGNFLGISYLSKTEDNRTIHSRSITNISGPKKLKILSCPIE